MIPDADSAIRNVIFKFHHNLLRRRGVPLTGLDYQRVRVT